MSAPIRIPARGSPGAAAQIPLPLSGSASSPSSSAFALAVKASPSSSSRPAPAASPQAHATSLSPRLRPVDKLARVLEQPEVDDPPSAGGARASWMQPSVSLSYPHTHASPRLRSSHASSSSSLLHAQLRPYPHSSPLPPVTPSPPPAFALPPPAHSAPHTPPLPSTHRAALEREAGPSLLARHLQTPPLDYTLRPRTVQTPPRDATRATPPHHAHAAPLSPLSPFTPLTPPLVDMYGDTSAASSSRHGKAPAHSALTPQEARARTSGAQSAPPPTPSTYQYTRTPSEMLARAGTSPRRPEPVPLQEHASSSSHQRGGSSGRASPSASSASRAITHMVANLQSLQLVLEDHEQRAAAHAPALADLQTRLETAETRLAQREGAHKLERETERVAFHASEARLQTRVAEAESALDAVGTALDEMEGRKEHYKRLAANKEALAALYKDQLIDASEENEALKKKVRVLEDTVKRYEEAQVRDAAAREERRKEEQRARARAREEAVAEASRQQQEQQTRRDRRATLDGGEASGAGELQREPTGRRRPASPTSRQGSNGEQLPPYSPSAGQHAGETASSSLMAAATAGGDMLK